MLMLITKVIRKKNSFFSISIERDLHDHYMVCLFRDKDQQWMNQYNTKLGGREEGGMGGPTRDQFSYNHQVKEIVNSLSMFYFGRKIRESSSISR